ncbi:MAG: sensor histidine kinase [Bacillota bacterium]
MGPSQAKHGKSPDKAPRVSTLYLKLRSRLSLYFLLLIALPFFFALAAAYFNARSRAEEAALETALARISQEKNSIGIRLEELELSISAAADALSGTRPAAKNTLLGDTGAATKNALSEDNGAAVKARSPVIIFDSPDEISSSTYITPLYATIPEVIRRTLTPGQQNALSGVYLVDGSNIKASYGPDSSHASISDPSSQKWFHDAVKNPDKVIIIGTVQRFYRDGAAKVVLCAAKSLYDGSDSPVNPVVLLFDFNYSFLADFLRTADGTKAERLITDYEGNILYCQDTGKLATMVDDAILEIIGSGDEGFGRIRYNNAYYYMTYSKYPGPGWIFIDLNPTSNVTGGLLARNPYLVACFIAIPLLLLAYSVASLRQIKPINDLTTVITDFESQFPGGHPGRTLPLLHGRPDTSVISGASDVDSLINKIYSIRLSQKEAELNSLQNQINPHFLYNTLESIRGAALYHGIHDIASMSKALSLLFRYSINDRVLVTVKEELQHLENYMSIQNFRYENKFELIYSIPPGMMNCKILKLTLQPLIENSIKHGLEMKLGKGTIKIDIMELDNNIKIQVSDNGLGMPPRKMEELNRSLASGKWQPGIFDEHSGTGIGVVNVNSRIKLYFGEQYGLRFMDVPVGTAVEIILPVVRDA